MELNIRCSGELVKFSKLKIYNSKLKKHSLLEIERLIDSIEKCGFLFPITVADFENSFYVIDGEARYSALCELSMRGYDVNKIPVVVVECEDEIELKRLMLMATSTNHCVTEVSLKEFVKGSDINLKDFGFNDGELIDFHTNMDIGLYMDVIGGKFSEQKLNKEDFEGLLK